MHLGRVTIPARVLDALDAWDALPPDERAAILAAADDLDQLPGQTNPTRKDTHP